MSQYYQGIYKVENREKYLGKGQNPEYRSSWECNWCYFFDHNEKVKRWGYEIIIIPYIGMDNRPHRYITDFYVEIQDINNNVGKFICEVKPEKDGPLIVDGVFHFDNKPQKPKVNNKKSLNRYMYEMKTYITNYKKWKAVEQYCLGKGFKFKILNKNPRLLI